jgi:CheY-like chemotaxis protein
MRVLFAEDNETLRETYKGIMVSLGHKVHAFRNGAEALEYLTQNPVDLLLTDYRMPIMDGLKLIREARKFGYEGPIVLTSMNSYLGEKDLGPGVRFVDKGESSKLLEILMELTLEVEVR